LHYYLKPDGRTSSTNKRGEKAALGVQTAAAILE
jgi:hypothetical protein